ncbi:tyrosine-type recombinase/integrase (plasmid) [Crocosphaera watsonii WH 8501]|uniref:Phage integrase n=1 Tax=Crocosphaera watsonii WH 8501 TaxID=165597 RepID=Q4C0J9_CROWT|nr:tyrosine-type recombinase/integrase [Crocosphaera watsonii]EAM49688.1 Phage integrase [Crocosphaera watsonii WH 8501]
MKKSSTAQKIGDLISISSDKGFLRLRFVKSISQQLWGIKSKSLYLQLSDTPKNREIAHQIAVRIINDIRANKLEKDLKNYLPAQELKKHTGIFYDPYATKLSLMELYEHYCEYKKNLVSEGTYLDQYRSRFLNPLKKCPQNLNKQEKIIEHLYNNVCSGQFKALSSMLYTMINWAKKRELCHSEFENNFKVLREEYHIPKTRRKAPHFVQQIPGYHQDKDYRAFTRVEAELIIQGFQEYYKTVSEKRNSWQIRRLSMFRFVCFLFWTGCRTSEASALRWKDIASDCSYLVFSHSYDRRRKKLKALKTEKVGEEGIEARKFPCGPKLMNLLLEMKSERSNDASLDDFIFLTSRGTPLTNHNIEFSWYGNYKGTELISEGIVYQLVREGKISQYLPPYATRHTWITLQLLANVPIINVAKLAGNSPEVILQHYAGYIPNLPLAVEV